MVLTLVLASVLPSVARAQTPDTTRIPVYRLDSLEVTATRTSRETFLTPAAVSVVGAEAIQNQAALGVTDAIRELPGLDVTGVGVQQPRPAIRGLRGQRILMLQDGLRLNNSRRQQDFGEVPSLIDVGQVERIEVVRGPASVLYGSDAIGGVVNVITRPAPDRPAFGTASYQYGSAYGLSAVRARAGGSRGRLSVEAGGHWRSASAYDAPSGQFGDIQLAAPARVEGTGVDDWSADIRLALKASQRARLFARAETYRADNAGFGLIDPSLYAPETPRIDITYPDQRFSKFTLGYEAQELAHALVDRFEVTAYAQDNERTLAFDFLQPLAPGAELTIVNTNTTDMTTMGWRAEAKKLAKATLWTYGMDGFRDRSNNSDLSVTTVTGFGPPSVEETSRPSVPNADYLSVGAFLQAERAFGRLTLIGGGRAQSVRAQTRTTQGLDEALVERNSSALVGALNAIVDVSHGFSLVGSVARGFRAPNLVEWFFEGPIPEALSYQARNPDLKPESSLSLDAGVRFRTDQVRVEAFAFQNTLTNGIRSDATGDTIQGFPVFASLNLDKLRYRGFEATAEALPHPNLLLRSGISHLTSEDVLQPDNRLGDTYANRVNGAVRWQEPELGLWAEWGIRRNGEQKEVDLARNPLGAILPAFTVQHARFGFRPAGEREGVSPAFTLSFENLTDALYAEFANASFFRPEPGRRVNLRVELGF